MTLEHASELIGAPALEVSDDLEGGAVYEWSIPLDANLSPDGRYGVRPLLTNLTVTVKAGRIISVHWE